MEAHPYIIDFHDQSLWEVKEEHADKALDLVARESYIRLNALVKGVIQIKGDGGFVNTLADAKLEE